MAKALLLLLLGYSPFLLSSQAWYEGKLEGWYYFEDKPQSSEGAPSISPQEADYILRSDKKLLEQLLSLALVVPSAENVSTYMHAQKRWIDQSARFANEWGRLLLENPLMGEFLKQPTTSYGILAKKEIDLNKRKSLLNRLSTDHFLLFVFQGKDPFSQKTSEVVQLFAQVNQWKVKAVSLDNQGVPEFPDFETDNGISEIIGVRASPSLFVINPFENRVVPVGAGLVTVSDIEENIELQFGEGRGS